MSQLRLFVAIPVPAQVKTELAAAQRVLTDANPHVRAVGIAGIHLTLKFLGETPSERIGEIRRAMEIATAAARAPIHLSCERLGAFPDLKRPRVLWAGLVGDVGPLGALFTVLDRELERVGFPREPREFHPHLTLGRLKEPKMLGALHKAWPKVEARAFGSFVAEALVLYRSELKPGGAVYTLIERVPLPAGGGGN